MFSKTKSFQIDKRFCLEGSFSPQMVHDWLMLKLKKKNDIKENDKQNHTSL